MKLKSFLFLSLLSFLLSCHQEDSEESLNNAEDAFTVLSAQEFNSLTRQVFSSIELNEEKFIEKTNEGVVYNFENLVVPDGFEHYQSRIFLPTESPNEILSNARAKEVIFEGLDSMGMTDVFISITNDVYSYVGNMDNVEIGEVEHYFTEKLQTVSISPALSELEKLALTQVLYHVKTAATASFEVEQEVAAIENAGGRVLACPPNWRDVAKSAFETGMAGGVTLGLQGIRAGAAATLAAGNPVAGGIIGGLAGFTIGFVAGAAGGGALKLMSDCLFSNSQQTTIPPKTFTCGGKVYYAYTASAPAGCTEGGGSFDISQIRRTPLVPRLGSSTISAEAIKQIRSVIR